MLPSFAPSEAEVARRVAGFPAARSFSTTRPADDGQDGVLDVSTSCAVLANLRMTLVKIRLGLTVSPVEAREALNQLNRCAKRYPSTMSDGFIRLDTARKVLLRTLAGTTSPLEARLDAVMSIHDEIKMLMMLPGHGIHAKE